MDLSIKPESQELESIFNGVEHDYEPDSLNSAHAIKEAEECGLDVVYPTEHQLQIDIDTEHAFSIFTAMYPIVSRYYGVRSQTTTPSRSGLPKRHITLTLYKKVAPFERIALQLALGSDRVREALAVARERRGDPHPVLFLERKA